MGTTFRVVVYAGGTRAARPRGPPRPAARPRPHRRSVEHACRDPAASAAYVRDHAQEMDPDVVRQHIGLYVNDFSVALGAEGERAVATLFDRASGNR